ncbi:MAG: transposase, partial [Chlamydiia bacterium]|nr:transposase [Chlamydiia bacterium]
MASIAQPLLFSWKDIDDSGDLAKLALVLESLPDENLVALLELRRSKGRNDYPVRACWNAMIAGIVYQHPSTESLLRELQRNPSLRELCGF